MSSVVFVYAANNEVTFYTDIDDDNVTEKVRYWLDTSTSQFKRTVTEPDCGVNPCDYTSASASSSTVVLVPNVRNTDPAACSLGGARDLFTFYRVDRGSAT